MYKIWVLHRMRCDVGCCCLCMHVHPAATAVIIQALCHRAVENPTSHPITDAAFRLCYSYYVADSVRSHCLSLNVLCVENESLWPHTEFSTREKHCLSVEGRVCQSLIRNLSMCRWFWFLTPLNLTLFISDYSLCLGFSFCCHPPPIFSQHPPPVEILYLCILRICSSSSSSRKCKCCPKCSQEVPHYAEHNKGVWGLALNCRGSHPVYF